MSGFESGSVFGQVVQVFQNAAASSQDAKNVVQGRLHVLQSSETEKATAAERAQGLIEQSAQNVTSAEQSVAAANASLVDKLREEVLALNAVEEAAKSRAAAILESLTPVIIIPEPEEQGIGE